MWCQLRIVQTVVDRWKLGKVTEPPNSSFLLGLGQCQRQRQCQCQCQYSTVQYSTVQYSTAQHSTAQHSMWLIHNSMFMARPITASNMHQHMSYFELCRGTIMVWLEERWMDGHDPESMIKPMGGHGQLSAKYSKYIFREKFDNNIDTGFKNAIIYAYIYIHVLFSYRSTRNKVWMHLWNVFKSFKFFKSKWFKNAFKWVTKIVTNSY